MDEFASQPELMPTPSGVELRGPQRSLHRAFERKCPRLAGWYMGALHVLADTRNPERFSHCAQSIRELMDKFPECAGDTALDIAGNAANCLHAIILDLEQLPLQSPGTDNSDSRVLGPKEYDCLARLHTTAAKYQDVRTTRGEQVRQTYHRLVPGGRNMPAEHLRRFQREWSDLRAYFNSVVHHNVSVGDELSFRAKLTEFEQLAGAQIAPTPTDDMELLDQLIREAELGNHH